MLLWFGDLMKRVFFIVTKVFITLVAIVMLVRVLLMVPHRFLIVERLVAVLIRALDRPERLECCWHAGLVGLWSLRVCCSSNTMLLRDPTILDVDVV
jgi:hypothetical protein